MNGTKLNHITLLYQDFVPDIVIVFIIFIIKLTSIMLQSVRTLLLLINNIKVKDDLEIPETYDNFLCIKLISAFKISFVLR